MSEISGGALEALARAISERLQAVVPEGALPNIPGDVFVQLDLFVDRDGALEDNLVHASHNILNHVQDEIIRDLKEGWPRAVDGKPGGRDSGKDLPDYEAAVNARFRPESDRSGGVAQATLALSFGVVRGD